MSSELQDSQNLVEFSDDGKFLSPRFTLSHGNSLSNLASLPSPTARWSRDSTLYRQTLPLTGHSECKPSPGACCQVFLKISYLVLWVFQYHGWGRMGVKALNAFFKFLGGFEVYPSQTKPPQSILQNLLWVCQTSSSKSLKGGGKATQFMCNKCALCPAAGFRTRNKHRCRCQPMTCTM